MVKALFVDLDGTLADSLPVLYSTYCDFLEQHGRQGTKAEFAELNGPALVEVVIELQRRHSIPGTPESIIREFHGRLYEQYRDSLPLFPGARDFLEARHTQGVRFGLVTSAPRDIAQAFLEGRDISDWFDHVITAEGGLRGKPYPDIYCHALSVFGVEPTQAVAIEDSHHGVTAAQEAGIHAVWMRSHASTTIGSTDVGAKVLRVDSWQHLAESWSTLATGATHQ